MKTDKKLLALLERYYAQKSFYLKRGVYLRPALPKEAAKLAIKYNPNFLPKREFNIYTKPQRPQVVIQFDKKENLPLSGLLIKN